MAYSLGYFDQMHFIKEFKEFSGFNPQEFIKADYMEIPFIFKGFLKGESKLKETIEAANNYSVMKPSSLQAIQDDWINLARGVNLKGAKMMLLGNKMDC